MEYNFPIFCLSQMNILSNLEIKSDLLVATDEYDAQFLFFNC